MDIQSLITDADGDHVFRYAPPRPDFDDSERESNPDPYAANATDELTAIVYGPTNNLNVSSNPVSPGPSSPPLDQPKDDDFIPPARPSSTPFLHSDPGHALRYPGADDAYDFSSAPPYPLNALDTDDTSTTKASLDDLPTEIHEAVLDHLFGFRVSPKSKSSVDLACVTKSWGTLMRYSRRKEISQLALVSPVWRHLIQSRLYRHIKVKGTQDSLLQAANWFLDHPVLARHVRHLEVWFPAFQPRFGSLPLVRMAPPQEDGHVSAASYELPFNNASLRQVFDFILAILPRVCILTLEGGERRKAPKVKNESSTADPFTKRIPSLENVRTLVTKGQWNLMRDGDDFDFIMTALPGLTEWHGSYSRPKSKSYLTMSKFLPSLPSNITHLTLFLEADYRREMSTPNYYFKVAQKVHFCTKLAEATPALEHLSYTGRVCRAFFDAASRWANPRLTRLKSIDLTVKNICRPLSEYQASGSGIFDMMFIQNFEALVLGAIRSMESLTALDLLRIRYVDLDSAVPPLNPYFLMKDNSCTGVWSDSLLRELNRVRPEAHYEELTENFGDLAWNKDGRLYVSTQGNRLRVRSLKISSYHIIQIPSISAI
ncbi:uncharacterized protein DNG_04748 [Cephalotrichum gorgonifer]|uniref:Uncharacterized protein n=1 Tax=Cephalotrichum gorgonifer TaxID=2041049 RepID=A0AAE8MX81_9PEZI|nr:uncharacterized protein DNG_04748 [Cephalotrichum gorgonifer]